MGSLAQVTIHPSQFPDHVGSDLFESLRSRQVNHKFHYDSIKQTQKWLALHQAFSPSRTDSDCAAAYDRSFAAMAARIRAPHVHLIGLGCGGGQKDARLLKLLEARGRELFYTPCDVSVAMVLVARQAVRDVIPQVNCFPLVCDLATANDLAQVFDSEQAFGPLHSALRIPQSVVQASDTARLLTFFGMIPNFEPEVILPKLASLVGPSDFLLFSANLAPGSDYTAGVQRILSLYDNDPTRDWLLTFLLDLGVEKTDGELRFVIEETGGLKRVAAYFRFDRPRKIHVDGQEFAFAAGESIRLFFSYRHTPDLVRTLLSRHGLRVADQWIAESEEEGVFLVSV